MGVTDGTREFVEAFRDFLIGFTDSFGTTFLTEMGGERVYQETPPAGAVYPYALVTASFTPPREDMDWHRRGVQLEVMIVDRPRAKLTRAQRLADMAYKAIHLWSVGSALDGSVQFRPGTMQSIPPGGDDTDREVVQIRVLADGYAWWRFST